MPTQELTVPAVVWPHESYEKTLKSVSSVLSGRSSKFGDKSWDALHVAREREHRSLTRYAFFPQAGEGNFCAQKLYRISEKGYSSQTIVDCHDCSLGVRFHSCSSQRLEEVCMRYC